MTALDPEAMQGTLMLEGARVGVLGYDADARAHALALRRAHNTVVIGVAAGSTEWEQARADGFVVDAPAAAVAQAEVVVVRGHDDPLWQRNASRVAPGALVVFASARDLLAGACARSGMDVVLVTEPYGAYVRLAVHRDVTRRALVRAIAYARAAFAENVSMRSTSITEEAEIEESGDRSRLLALAVSAPPLEARVAPPPAWDVEADPEPAEMNDATWFYAMLNRRGSR